MLFILGCEMSLQLGGVSEDEPSDGPNATDEMNRKTSEKLK